MTAIHPWDWMFNWPDHGINHFIFVDEANHPDGFKDYHVRASPPPCINSKYLAMSLRDKTRIDDSLDVWACHGVGGTWGAIATGIFASAAVNAACALFFFVEDPQAIFLLA